MDHQNQAHKASILKSLFLLLTVLFSVQTSTATHMLGADIEYEHLGARKYRFIVKAYRDCRGIPLGTPKANLRCASGGTAINVALVRRAIEDVSWHDKSLGKPCNPQNTRAFKGVERHTYTVDIDFNASAFSSLLSCSNSCEVIFELNECCRSTFVTTGITGNFYSYAIIKLCLKAPNSSPTFKSPPQAFLCCNEPVAYNGGAKDTIDNDILTYSWVKPLATRTNTIAYNSPLSYKLPFTVHDPKGTGIPNPNAKPPVGLFLHPRTGNIVFTPTKCNEVTTAVLQVTEKRKDSTGILRTIGIIRRDMTFFIESCKSKVPLLSQPFDYATPVEEELCFTIKSSKPKKPSQPPTKDTVRLTWDQSIPNATFTLSHDSVPLQSALFCWTPKKSDLQVEPYYFNVTARDNSTPANLLYTRSYSVRVVPVLKGSFIKKDLGCNGLAYESAPDKDFAGTPKFNWNVLDTFGNPLNDSAVFNGTGKAYSDLKTDTLRFKYPGTYILEHVLTSREYGVRKTMYDTLVITSGNLISIALQPDTFVCANTDLKIEPVVMNQDTSTRYLWSNGDTTLTSTIQLAASDSFKLFSIVADHDLPCPDTASILVYKRQPVYSNAGIDRRICDGDQIRLFYQDSIHTSIHQNYSGNDTVQPVDTLFKRWIYQGKVISELNSYEVGQPGEYILEVDDSLGCLSSDTMMLYVNDPVKADAGPNLVHCSSDSVFLQAQGLDTSGNNKTGWYRWWDLHSQAPQKVDLGGNEKLALLLETSNRYELELMVQEDTVSCVDKDTLWVTIDPNPEVTIDTSIFRDPKIIGFKQPPFVFCQNRDNFKITASPKGGNWTSNYPSSISGDTFVPAKSPEDTEFTLTYRYVDTKNCSGSDSVSVKVITDPKPTISRTGDTLFASSGKSYQWYDKSGKVTQGHRPYIVLKKTGKYIVEVGNICGKLVSDSFEAAQLNIPFAEESRIHIYPNPSTGLLTIEIPENKGASIKLIDIQGKNVFQSSSERVRSTIDVGHLAKGPYYIEIEFDGNRVYRKLVLE